MSDTEAVVLIPARDEAGTIAETVRACRELRGVADVIVADDASTDGTGRLAAEAGARVVTLRRRSGKGAALRAALAASPGGGRVHLLLDADLGASATHAADLLAPVMAGRADMTVAVFPPSSGGGLGLALGLARWGIRRLSGFEARAPLSGQRALSTAALERVTPFANGYGVEVAMTVRALRAGLRVSEVEVPMSHRFTGRDAAGFAHRGRQFAHVALTLLRLAAEPR